MHVVLDQRRVRYIVVSADEVRRFAPLPRTVYLVEDHERSLHLFALATGIGRFRDPFLNTVSGTFLQQVSTNIDPPDPS